ncbi:MAG: signal peptidase II [Clostridia bacterium]|nr:signal peptidase II [Clostridia bacterium]
MRLRRGCRGAWIALLAALIDRLTKAAVTRLARPRALAPGLLNLRPVENRGMAFSMLSGQTLALTLVTAALVAGLVGWLIAKPDAPRLARAGLWLIVGGGLGNLYDRLTAGGVTDFLELAFVRFAVFNVADVCICVGAALVVVSVWREERKNSDLAQ